MQKLLDLLRARRSRIGEVAASLRRHGRELGEIGLWNAELGELRRPGERRQRLDAAGGIVGRGFTYFTNRASAGFACPTVIPWITIHTTHHQDIRRGDQGGTAFVGSG